MWLLLALISFFSAGMSGLNSLLPGHDVTVNVVSTSACYALDETKRITVDQNWLFQDDCRAKIGGRTYVGIRPDVRIVNAKIAEGKGAHPNNDCGDSFYGSLRKVGTLPSGEDIYWESENHKHGDLRDFLLIQVKKDDRYHHFDVYIDETLKDNLPDFVVNCKETGGIVPVLEGPNSTVFPPQFIPLDGINHSDPVFAANYAKYVDYYKEWFVRIQENAIPAPAEQIGVFIPETVGSETHKYDVFFHAGILYIKDQADGKSYMYNPSDTAPDFPIERDATLQLKEQKFISTAEWTWATPECKPALYLYPEETTTLSIKVEPKGRLTRSIPKHGLRGWTVIANHGGQLKLTHDSQPKTYNYLYYESALTDFSPPTKGWVVKTKKLPFFFASVLPKLGLRENETRDFTDYWVKNLTREPYYFVGLVSREEIDRVEPIKFSKEPDTFIRVRFYFKPLPGPESIPYPSISAPPHRKGFTAVDWGGMLSSGACTPEGTVNVISK